MESILKTPRILVIDDEPKILEIFKQIFAIPIETGDPNRSLSENANSFDLECASQGQAGYEMAQQALEEDTPFAVAFIDMRMPPGWDGFKTAQKIREMDDRIYIIIVTAFADRSLDELQEVIQHNFLLVQKPFSIKEVFQLGRNFCHSWSRDVELSQYRHHLEELVAARTEALEESNIRLREEITERKRVEEELKHLSIHDILTGLYNRAYFQEEMSRLEASRQYPISIIVADVDHLKEVNDEEGHQQGDKLLIETAEVLRASFRPEDVVTRIGGDEFAILLPEANEQVAESVIQRVREELARRRQMTDERSLSISLGFATVQKGGSISEAFRLADEAMYAEKFAQRKNRD